MVTSLVYKITTLYSKYRNTQPLMTQVSTSLCLYADTCETWKAYLIFDINYPVYHINVVVCLSLLLWFSSSCFLSFSSSHVAQVARSLTMVSWIARTRYATWSVTMDTFPLVHTQCQCRTRQVRSFILMSFFPLFGLFNENVTPSYETK